MKNSPPDAMKIEFDFNSIQTQIGRYQDVVGLQLTKLFKEQFPFFTEAASSTDELRKKFEMALPFLSYTKLDHAPGTISIYLISKYRANAFKYFFEMITTWLMPGYKLNVPLFIAGDFYLKQLGHEMYTYSELILDIQSEAELQEIERNLPLIDTEIRLGVKSVYYASRVMEVKGLSVDQKTAIVQEYLAYLIQRYPDHFDYDIFTEMQHVLVICRDVFKNIRDSKHLSRIIAVTYMFRKALTEAVRSSPDKRHFFVKLFRANLNLRPTKKSVLGILVGMNILGNKEIFEDRHLLRAIQNYIPSAQLVEGSYFSHRLGGENLATVYLEVEKADGELFSPEEIRRLRNDLPTDLKDRIEHVIQPVFMPRNEEEILRNILHLGQQIKFVRDVPHVILTFDEQSVDHLFFTIILMRATKEESLSIAELFEKADTFLEYIHDFKKNMGRMRNMYIKEATVFRIKLPKDMFLRDDHSIDLYKARQVVVAELERIIGEIRDFNGGMISRQNEMLCRVRGLLADEGIVNDFLLENFFYSLKPASMRSVFDHEALKKLFRMLLDLLGKGYFSGKNYAYTISRNVDVVYVMVITESASVKRDLSSAVTELNIPSGELGSTLVMVQEIACFGYLYFCGNPDKQDLFCQTLSKVIIQSS